VISRDRSKRLVFGIFTGIMLIMILYHIPLFVKGRENSYLYYILYILAFLVFFVHKEGYIYELMPRLISAPISIFLLEIFLLFYLLFGRPTSIRPTPFSPGTPFCSLQSGLPWAD
jgi:hypothetical protein